MDFALVALVTFADFATAFFLGAGRFRVALRLVATSELSSM
jgi:hypothetical protein